MPAEFREASGHRPGRPLESYIGQSPDAIIAACFRDTPEGKTLRRCNRQHYAAQLDAFQRQVAGDLRQQVQYCRVVRSCLIHNGVMLQAGWQYRQALKGRHHTPAIL